MGLLNNKNIVIIGGTTGLGRSASEAFVRNGANIVMVGRNPENAEKAAKELGSQAECVIGDASLEKTAIDAIEGCIHYFGGFDGLYHVAGGSGRRMGDGPLHEMTLEGWNKTLEWNLTSNMISNRQAIIKFMEMGTAGTILNTSSVLGHSPSPFHFATHAYAAAKSSIIGFSKSIAAYYSKNNIRVNVIAPGLVETPMAQRAAENEKTVSYIRTKQPLDGGRIGVPSDLDGLAVYFMSEQSKFTTGQVVSVDGGWSVSEGQG